jgi:hypothetical protein
MNNPSVRPVSSIDRVFRPRRSVCIRDHVCESLFGMDKIWILGGVLLFLFISEIHHSEKIDGGLAFDNTTENGEVFIEMQ